MINGGSSGSRSSRTEINEVTATATATATAVDRRSSTTSKSRRRASVAVGRGGGGGSRPSLTRSSAALLLVLITLSCVAVRDSRAFIVKRSFVRIGCMGHYDKAVFATLDRICEECYNLYREIGLHTLCRSDCFKNEYFSGCVKALLLSDKQGEIDVMVNKLYGGSK